ncbi:MAG: glutathione-disulfide reductase [Pseudomonadota bacterium]
MAREYDLFVIGGGSGGVRAARIAATHGAKVGVAEEYRYGGTCVIRGCVPKKLFVFASKFSGEFKDAAGYGWSVGPTHFDWPTLLANKDREIDRLEDIYRSNLRKAGVDMFDDRAVFEDAGTLRLVNSGETIKAEKVLVAVGATPNYDTALPGIEHVISSNEAFHLERFPDRVVVAGGGYIAVEFAGIFNGLGAETTLIYRGEEILRGFDDDVRRHIHTEMEKKGVTIICEDIFSSIEKNGAGLVGKTKQGRTLPADEIMFAIGRNPNTKDLGLEKAGIETDALGAIVVDGYSKTSADTVWAVGDVTNRVNLTPVAIREGHAFADTVFGGKDVRMDHRMIPTAVFSQPEFGTVGLTEAEARETHRNLDIYRTSFRAMKNVLAGSEERAFMKLLVDADSDRVLGCHVVGPDAGELAQVLGIAVKMGATKADFDQTVAVHPTVSEELVTMREPDERVRPDRG